MSLKGRNTGLRFCVQSPLETARPAGTSSPSLRLVSNSTLRRLVLCEEISGTSQFWPPHAWEALKVQGSLTPMAPRHFLLGWSGSAQPPARFAHLEVGRCPAHSLFLPPESCFGQGLGPEKSRALRILVSWR